MTKLTKEELLTLIQIVSEYPVPVKNSKAFIDLINKMSVMVDELKAQK